MEWNGMEWNGREWNGMEMEWNRMEWNGMEWIGMECNVILTVYPFERFRHPSIQHSAFGSID